MFDNNKKQTVASLGMFKFDGGQYEFEIVRYDGGDAKVSYRRFRSTQDEHGETTYVNDKNKAWISDSEAKALLAGFTAAVKWCEANPQPKKTGKEKKAEAPQETAST